MVLPHLLCLVFLFSVGPSETPRRRAPKSLPGPPEGQKPEKWAPNLPEISSRWSRFCPKRSKMAQILAWKWTFFNFLNWISNTNFKLYRRKGLFAACSRFFGSISNTNWSNLNWICLEKWPMLAFWGTFALSGLRPRSCGGVHDLGVSSFFGSSGGSGRWSASRWEKV